MIEETFEVFGPITKRRSSIVTWTASDIGLSRLIYMNKLSLNNTFRPNFEINPALKAMGKFYSLKISLILSGLTSTFVSCV